MLDTLNNIQQKIYALRREQHQTNDVRQKIILSRRIKMYKMLRTQLFLRN